MPESLPKLLKEIRTCRICIDDPKGAPLPHEPRPVVRASKTARLAVFGQAPGNLVHQTGKPFNDPSGVRLREWMGVTPDEFYDEKRVAIIPMGFCFPGYDGSGSTGKGGDLPPRKECAAHWHARILTALPQLELCLLVGGYSQKWHLGKNAKKTLTDTVTAWRDYGPRFIPTPHPSWRNNGWLKKHLWFEDELLPHLRERVRALI